MDKELDKNVLDMNELENVAGGLEQAGNLLFTGKENQKTSNTLFSGKKKKAGNLVYKETSASGVNGKLISGDFADKGTFC